MRTHSFRSLVAIFASIAILLGVIGPAIAQTPQASPVAASITGPLDSSSSDVDLDVLFIGAHPDDEAFGLAAYGQWNEYAGMEVGVITVTRGEGGGNAVGTEEGPALGLLREGEEREAVAHAGITHIYNLDKVDFYYTVSAPLTAETWDYQDTLSRVVRVVRATKPEIIITMNPSPTPGNHGHHQVAARLAVDAFSAAADGEAFPDAEFAPWTVSSIYRAGADGEQASGPDCGSSFVPAEATDTVFGVWQGTVSERNGGRSWGAVARDGQRTYASQGWAGFPDEATNPDEIGCNYFTLIDTRVPISDNRESPDALLFNAAIQEEGGLPLGSRFWLEPSSFIVAPGQSMRIDGFVEEIDGASVTDVTVTPPEGWAHPGVGPGTPQVTRDMPWPYVVPEDAAPGRYVFEGVLTVGDTTARTTAVVQVVPAVSGVMEPLPEIAQFQEWAKQSGVEQLNNLISPVTSIGVGKTELVGVVVTNNSEEVQSGTVELTLPEGFAAAESSLPYDALEPGASVTVEFAVTNTDSALPTSNQGGTEGTYPVTITTTSNSSTAESAAGINLVPSTVVPKANGPIAVDGVVADGEYTGDALDLSRVWEGDDPESPADASGSAHVTWTDEGLYVAVDVVDDTQGTILTPEDAKRHWRTDSVEIAIDPLGTAPNTSATFKVGVFPTTTDGQPAAYRDADAFQGPVSETAPGFQVASAMAEPYAGYTIETFIPFTALPAGIDRNNAALIIFIYDSDTQDLTGQTRLGWSTWNGVQGDPYRWGEITLAESGEASPAATPIAEDAAAVEVAAPVMPLEAAQSVLSPLSIAQSAGDGVPLAGMPGVMEGEGITSATLGAGTLTIDSATAGEAHVFVVSADGSVVAIDAAIAVGSNEVAVTAVPGDLILVSFLTEEGSVQAIAIPAGD